MGDAALSKFVDAVCKAFRMDPNPKERRVTTYLYNSLARALSETPSGCDWHRVASMGAICVACLLPSWDLGLGTWGCLLYLAEGDGGVERYG